MLQEQLRKLEPREAISGRNLNLPATSLPIISGMSGRNDKIEPKLVEFQEHKGIPAT